ncbi:MAG TPA: hypothetical protein VLG09_02370 [Candidatus Saccharimonadales bacterium]|nr:hypothetical protein [Candidatus Saccharimonadales bacterium]
MLQELRRLFFGPVRVRRGATEMIVDINAGSSDEAVRCLQNILDRPAAYNLFKGYPLEPVSASISGFHRRMRIVMETGLPDSKRMIRIVIHDISVGYKGAADAASVAAILVMLNVGEEWETLHHTVTTPNKNRGHADAWKSYYEFDLNP